MLATLRFFLTLSIVALAGYAAASLPSSASVNTGATRAHLISTASSSAPFAPLAPGEGDTALNWAGYVATGDTYTSVSATWVVPEVVDTTGGNSADATWVGIGGTVTSDLIQAGTEAIPTYDGTLEYRAWTEALPAHSEPIPLDIAPGDVVTVSISYGGNRAWDISFVDHTSGDSYHTSILYASTFSSAEWIEEMPVAVRGRIGLDDFGEVRFQNAYAAVGGVRQNVAGAYATPLIMTNDSDDVVASPSALGLDGASFVVRRTAADPTPLTYTSDTSDLSGYTTTGAQHRREWLLGL